MKATFFFPLSDDELSLLDFLGFLGGEGPGGGGGGGGGGMLWLSSPEPDSSGSCCCWTCSAGPDERNPGLSVIIKLWADFLMNQG